MDNYKVIVFAVLIASFVLYVIAAAAADRKRKNKPEEEDPEFSGEEESGELPAAGKAVLRDTRYCHYCMAPVRTGADICPQCSRLAGSSNLPHQLPAGTVIDDRYYIGSALGEKNSVITYAARDEALGIRICVKEYFPSDCVRRGADSFGVICTGGPDDQIFVSGKKRFMRDMRTLCSLGANTSAVTVRDLFEANGTVCAVTDYVAGKPLAERLYSGGLFSSGYALSLFVPVLRQLAAEEAAGLIRCNITPDSFTFFEDKLYADGTAVRGGSIPSFPKAGFAPEELFRKSGTPGAWTDVYSVCAVLYRCMTGQIPDEASERVYKDALRAPSSFGIPITPAFEHAVMKGLSVYREDRWQNCAELLDAIFREEKQPAGGASFFGPIIDPVEEDHDFVPFGGNDPAEPVDNDIAPF